MTNSALACTMIIVSMQLSVIQSSIHHDAVLQFSVYSSVSASSWSHAVCSVQCVSVCMSVLQQWDRTGLGQLTVVVQTYRQTYTEYCTLHEIMYLARYQCSISDVSVICQCCICHDVSVSVYSMMQLYSNISNIQTCSYYYVHAELEWLGNMNIISNCITEYYCAVQLHHAVYTDTDTSSRL